MLKNVVGSLDNLNCKRVVVCGGVLRPKIPRMGKAKNVYLRYYFHPFVGKKKY